MDDIYQLVADKLGWYARLYGWEHTDNHWGNFLFSDDLTEVSIIEYVHMNDALLCALPYIELNFAMKLGSRATDPNGDGPGRPDGASPTAPALHRALLI